MQNPFKFFADTIKSLDARLKRLERMVADLIMILNSQIGQAKYVRNQTGGKASQVTIPGSVGGNDAGDVEAIPLEGAAGDAVLDCCVDISFYKTDGTAVVKKGKMPVIIPSGNLTEEGFDIVTPVLDSSATVWATRGSNNLVDESGTMNIVIKNGSAYPVAVIA